jgi:putative oxidoreductase
MSTNDVTLTGETFMSTLAHRTPAGRVNSVAAFKTLLRTDKLPGITILRVVLAAVLFPHGAQHLLGWFGGYGFAGTHEWMTATLGLPSFVAAGAIIGEFIAPFALVLGIGGRVAALFVVALMAGAASTHAANGFFMNWFGSMPAGAEGYEYHVLVMAMALAIVIQGSGAWSFDRAVTGNDVNGR